MTHGEYVYDLLKRLQRHFRCSDTGYRMYLYNFYFNLLNYPGVELNEETWQNFVDQMDEDCVYYGNKGLTSLSAIYQDDGFSTSYTMLQKSFAAIGITLEIISGGEGACNFTMPDGTVLYLRNAYANYSYLCARSGMDYDYAQKAAVDYYYDKLEDADDLNGSVAGYGTCWEYDPDAATLEITGEGSLVSKTLFNSLTVDFSYSSSSDTIANAVTTIILGAGVNRLMANSLNYTKDMTIVCLRGARADLVLDSGFAGSGTSDTPYNWTIYTDNADLITATFPGNKAVTFKTLSEWEG